MVRQSPIIYAVTRSITRATFLTIYRIEVEREEPLSLKGPAVILPKHQHWTDIPLVALSFPMPLLFVAKQELFRYPGICFALKMLGGIPIDRRKTIRTLNEIRFILSGLRASGKIVIFPEGTYVRGRVGVGKSRLLQLILRFQLEIRKQIPFIPMGIRYMEKGGWRKSVEIRIGHPLFAPGESDAIPLTQKIMEEVSRLSELPPASHFSKPGKEEGLCPDVKDTES